jgi:hypothetical protein
MGRLEIHLPATAKVRACEVILSGCTLLPIGSSIDEERGIFYCSRRQRF